MIGYDVGARIDRDDDASGLSAGRDAQLSHIHGILDRFNFSVGTMPEMVASFTGNVTDLATVLNGAAEVADRMHGDGGGGEGLSADAMAPEGQNSLIPASGDQDGLKRYRRSGVGASFGDAEKLSPYPDYGRIVDALPLMSAPFADSVFTEAPSGADQLPFDLRGQQPALEINDVLSSVIAGPGEAKHILSESPDRNKDPLQAMMMDIHGFDWNMPDVARLTGNDALGGYPLSQARNGDEGGDKFDAGFGLLGSSSGPDDWHSDGPIGAGNFDNFYNRYAKMMDEDNTASGSERLALLGTDGEAFDSFDDELGEGSFAGEDGILYDRINDFSGLSRIGFANNGEPAGVRENISDFKDTFDPLIDRELANGSIWNSAPRERGMGLGGGWQLLDDIAIDETPAVNSPSGDTRGLLGMLLKNAERILPKPGFARDEIEGETTADNAGDTREEASIAPAGGRYGPSGHRNDPIYTVAIGTATGTLMPMVPTPGMSTRTPPIPGQRNLP